MNNESLEKSLDAFIETLSKLDIDQSDKVELMINLKSFLSTLTYSHNIQVLERERLRIKEERAYEYSEVPKRK